MPVVDFMRAATRRGLLRYNGDQLRHIHSELWQLVCPDQQHPSLDFVPAAEIIDEIVELHEQVP